MNGYEIEELYYLYRQGCPIAQTYLLDYCYRRIKAMLPAYYFTQSAFENNCKDYVQIIMMRCLVALDSYRPDRGMMVKSFISLIIQNEVSTVVVKRRGNIVKEHFVLLSLDDYCSEDESLRYIDGIRDERTPERLLLQQEEIDILNKYILKVCSSFERAVIACHRSGLKNHDIALKLNKDVRCIYNANYRIQKKMENSNIFD